MGDCHTSFRSIALALVGCVLTAACSGEPAGPLERRAQTVENARAALKYDHPELAVSIITSAPAEDQADPALQALLAQARRQAGMSKESRQAENIGAAMARSRAAIEALDSADVADIEGAAAVVSDFKNAALVLRQAERLTLNEPLATEARELRALAVDRQERLYPKVRKAYALRMGDDLASVGVGITAAGPRSKTLRVASSILTTPLQIEEVHGRLVTRATALRFARAEYQAYMGGQVTSYKLNGKPDDALDY